MLNFFNTDLFYYFPVCNITLCFFNIFITKLTHERWFTFQFYQNIDFCAVSIRKKFIFIVSLIFFCYSKSDLKIYLLCKLKIIIFIFWNLKLNSYLKTHIRRRKVDFIRYYKREISGCNESKPFSKDLNISYILFLINHAN